MSYRITVKSSSLVIGISQWFFDMAVITEWCNDHMGEYHTRLRIDLLTTRLEAREWSFTEGFEGFTLEFNSEADMLAFTIGNSELLDRLKAK